VADDEGVHHVLQGQPLNVAVLLGRAELLHLDELQLHGLARHRGFQPRQDLAHEHGVKAIGEQTQRFQRAFCHGDPLRNPWCGRLKSNKNITKQARAK
jgi:hypothetical protein